MRSRHFSRRAVHCAEKTPQRRWSKHKKKAARIKMAAALVDPPAEPACLEALRNPALDVPGEAGRRVSIFYVSSLRH
jgi:hypothetical protein